MLDLISTLLLVLAYVALIARAALALSTDVAKRGLVGVKGKAAKNTGELTGTRLCAAVTLGGARLT